MALKQGEIITTEPNNSNLPVMDAPETDISKFTALQGTSRRQGMEGFDPDYVDIVDYIVRVTHRIWEEKGIGLIYDTYNHNVIIHTTEGTFYGREKVVADTAKAQSAFTDLYSPAQDVIWTGNDKDGFHSSHRAIYMATNNGYSAYGPPTRRRVSRFVIAHCFVKENRIVEEWLTRDELATVRQLGYDPIELAKRMAARDAASGVRNPALESTGEIDRVLGQTTPAPLPPLGRDFEPELFVRRVWHEVWNWRLLNNLRQYYSQNYEGYVSSHRELYGMGDLSSYILALIAAFPDLVMNVDWVGFLGDSQKGYRVAVRWTMQGTHQGPGHYGDPSGKRIKLLGNTHYFIKDGKIAKEWTLFDEFALLKQIYWPS
jgi:predicted ester cyclase